MINEFAIIVIILVVVAVVFCDMRMKRRLDRPTGGRRSSKILFFGATD